MEPIKTFIGKTVIIRYNLPTGQILRFQGIVLDITDISIVLDDFKDGHMVLPLAQCQITEVKNG